MELCFLCMENKTKAVSIGGLLRHLNINRESVPLSESACSKDLNGGNEIKVGLCEACEMINKRFSVLFQQLLKVQLEMDYLLKKIRSCLIAGNDGNFMAKCSKMKSENGQAWIASMDNLRKEINEQCLKKQSGPVPCIKLSKVKLKHNEVIIKEEIDEEPDLEELQEAAFEDNFAADTFADSPLYFISSSSPQVPEVKSRPVVLSTASEEPGNDFPRQNGEFMEEENIQDTETTQPVPSIITGTSLPPEGPPKSPPQSVESTTATVKQPCSQHDTPEVTSQQKRVEDSLQTPLEPEIKVKPKECHSKDPVTRLYHCKICNKTSPNSVTIVRHYEREHLQKRLKCDICNKAVATRSDHLAVHKKSCRQNLEKLLEKKKDPKYKFPCDLCQQRFTSRHFLDTHRLHVHVSIGRFVCELCGKKFKRLTHLKAHNDGVHLGVKYSCKFCEVSYACKYQIRRHEKACSKNTNKK